MPHSSDTETESDNQGITQLTLNLTTQPTAELENFVEPEDARIVASIKDFLGRHEETILFVSGEPSSGKSHLLLAASHLFPAGEAYYLPFTELAKMEPVVLEGLEQARLLCFDDLDLITGRQEWEEALFHLFNRCQQQGCQWIVGAGKPPAQLPLALADLRSRLGWGIVLRLPELDESLRLRVLEQQARHFGFALSDEVKQFIIRRAPRDLGSLTQLLYRIDKASLEEKRAITVPFIKSITGW